MMFQRSFPVLLNPLKYASGRNGKRCRSAAGNILVFGILEYGAKSRVGDVDDVYGDIFPNLTLIK
jgi:hypothetical protein